MVGAIVTGRFNALTGAHATLGTLRAGAGSLRGSEHALANSFHFAFLGCAAMSILGFAIALLAHDPMLRTTVTATPQGE
jgi:hypothetical protein